MSKTESCVNEVFPYLPVTDGSAAVKFYTRVLGAQEPRGQFSPLFLQKPPLRFLLREGEGSLVSGLWCVGLAHGAL